VPGTLPAIDPRRTALLVMDYQAGILARLPDADVLVGRAGQAIDLVRDRGGHVGYVRVAFEGADYDAIPATSMMGARVAAAGSAFRADSPLTVIDERIAPRPGDVSARRELARSRLLTWTTSCVTGASRLCCWPDSAPAASCCPRFGTLTTATIGSSS
jgi:nicotinamidase-related amidase